MSTAKSKELADSGRRCVGKNRRGLLKDRESNTVRAKVVDDTTGETLQGFEVDSAEVFATMCTDDAKACTSLPLSHDTVKRSLEEYVRGEVHTNGVESFWSMFKRVKKGTFHNKLSPKHLNRATQEFANKHNLCELGALQQIAALPGGRAHQRLHYWSLIA